MRPDFGAETRTAAAGRSGRWVLLSIIGVAIVLIPVAVVESPTQSRVISVAGLCLLLWLGEIVPPFVPTLLLWTLVPVVLAPIDTRFSLTNVLSWAADPVMALFFGGFVLGAATDAQGIARRLAEYALRSARGSFHKLLFFVMLLTAFLSMWMSNIAAAALTFACLQPILDDFGDDRIFRRLLLIGVALGADLGGMATPIGTGPNAIAIASLSSTQPVTFLTWMIFALPLTLGMLLVCYSFLVWRSRSAGDFAGESNRHVKLIATERNTRENGHGRIFFILILSTTIVLWLTEPFHKIPAAATALAASVAIFASGILSTRDLTKIDWSTLFLIAGGITLGRMLEQSSLLANLASNVPFDELHPTLGLFLLCLMSAVLSALMSNTATAVLLIPIATAFIPSHSTAILIAISASFGVPFLISTPPNAMAFGQGGLRFTDMLWPGLLVMILGCALVSLTGPDFLALLGIT